MIMPCRKTAINAVYRLIETREREGDINTRQERETAVRGSKRKIRERLERLERRESGEERVAQEYPQNIYE